MNHYMMVPDMAVSQSLTAIMEEMVTKVMEDAVSTSIIFTQAPVKEEHKVIEMQSLTWCLFMFAL